MYVITTYTLYITIHTTIYVYMYAYLYYVYTSTQTCNYICIYIYTIHVYTHTHTLCDSTDYSSFPPSQAELVHSAATLAEPACVQLQ